VHTVPADLFHGLTPCLYQQSYPDYSMAIKHRQLGLLPIFYVKMQAGGDYHVIFTLST
jgi:hypothetical protein